MPCRRADACLRAQNSNNQPRCDFQLAWSIPLISWDLIGEVRPTTSNCFQTQARSPYALSTSNLHSVCGKRRHFDGASGLRSKPASRTGRRHRRQCACTGLLQRRQQNGRQKIPSIRSRTKLLGMHALHRCGQRYQRLVPGIRRQGCVGQGLVQCLDKESLTPSRALVGASRFANASFCSGVVNQFFVRLPA